MEISAIGLLLACCGLSIPSPHGPHLARSGGGYRHGMVNQTNASRPDELFTTEPDQA